MGAYIGRGLLTMKTESHLTVQAELVSVSYVRAIFESEFLISVGLRHHTSIKIFQLVDIKCSVKLLR